MPKSLSGQIAIVTGASRGIGKGVALQLGAAGATVYVTGRKPAESDGAKRQLPTLERVAQEITARGGKGIAAYVDHADMSEVKEFFERVEKEYNGQLDILVNNAFSAVNFILENNGKKIHEVDPEVWDIVNNVGLRNHYYCTHYATRLMVKQRRGLIVNISSGGGIKYVYNVAYGVGKEGLDRMAADAAFELKKDNVTVVSLWPGYVRTELVESAVTDKMQKGGSTAKSAEKTAQLMSEGESIEYAGLAIAHLAADPNRHSKTGRVLITEDLGSEYGFKDIDGRQPTNIRSLAFLLDRVYGCTALALWIPAWVRLPGWALTLSGGRL